MSHSKDMGKKNLHEDGGVRRQQLLSAWKKLKKFFKRPYKKVVPVAYALRGHFQSTSCSLKSTYPATEWHQADEPEMEQRCGGCAKTTCTDFLYKDGPTRWRAVLIHPKAALASCLAMILSADNGTPAQPQRNVMGAARRDPRRGARPVERQPAAAVWNRPLAWDVATNKARSTNVRNRGNRIPLWNTVPALYTGEMQWIRILIF